MGGITMIEESYVSFNTAKMLKEGQGLTSRAGKSTGHTAWEIMYLGNTTARTRKMIFAGTRMTDSSMSI